MSKENPVDYSVLRADALAGDMESALVLAEALSKDTDNWVDLDGEVKPEIQKEIFSWLTKAAESGHAAAMFRLSLELAADTIYDEAGKWSWFDTGEAYSWLLKAVELNHAEAQALLGNIMCLPDTKR